MSYSTAPDALHSLVRRAEPITGEELAVLPGMGPCELVEGRIAPMSPTSWYHGRIVQRIATELDLFVRDGVPAEVLTGEVGIYTRRDPDTVRGADVLVISSERLGEVRSKSFLDVPPELVVEILSPSNPEEDLRRKVDEYLGVGVDHVWVIDPDRREVQVYEGGGGRATLTQHEMLRGEGLLAGFEVSLQEIFAA